MLRPATGHPATPTVMKRIFSSPVTGEIPRLRDMLESAGIKCILRNEISSGLSPDIPLNESTPELWIEDDARLAEVLQIKADFQSSARAVGNDWRCPKCGEVSEPQFTSCWNCGTVRSEPGPVEWVPRELAAPPPENEAVVEETEGGRPCVACEKHIPVDSKLCPFCGWTQP